MGGERAAGGGAGGSGEGKGLGLNSINSSKGLYGVFDEVLVVSLRSIVVSLLVVIAVSDVAGHISNALIMIACICILREITT